MWMGNYPINPGEEVKWEGTYNVYTDTDFDGHHRSIPEKLTGVFVITQCGKYKNDETFLDQIFIPIDPVCPIK